MKLVTIQIADLIDRLETAASHYARLERDASVAGDEGVAAIWRDHKISARRMAEAFETATSVRVPEAGEAGHIELQ